jgi:glycosyltransferase involved in cell wall biosynthesis
VLDVTSGAALSIRTLLEGLAARGFRAAALQATVFDSPQGGEHVLKAATEHQDKPFLRTVAGGVEHVIVRTKATRRGEMTCAEQELFLRRFRAEIAQRRPDMLLLWGGMLLEMTMMREAREAGIPVVFYLVNPGYKRFETFPHVSVVVTDTHATAQLYRERLGLDCKVIGKFVAPARVKATVPRRPDFITFVNPGFEKGVSVFMPLAKLAARECPHVRFLVVQSRGRWGQALQVLKFKPEDFPNVKVIGHQTDMRPVYASTRALLVPSLWHESGARVIAEAQINGIPVIASNTGGTAELVGEGGVVFDLPQEVRDRRTVPAPEEVVRPWLDAVRRVWDDEAWYQDLCRKVEREAVQHDIAHNVERFLRAVSPAVLASKGLARRVAASPTAPVTAAPAPVAAGPAAPAVKSAQTVPTAPTAQTVLQQALARKQAQAAARARARRR